jgi:cation diffusion facilitator family transporter
LKTPGQVQTVNSRIKIIRIVLALSVVIMFVKFLAFWFTRSGAVLSDALESLINIATSAFTLYSIYYAARMRDEDHPYGHGKVEYFAIGFEGALIFGTGIYIIIHSINRFIHPHELGDVDSGILLTVLSGLAMYFIGSFLKKKGAELHSHPLKADGAHFHTDAVTSAGLIGGLFLYRFTGWYWIDPLLAAVLALHIIFSGFILIRESVDRLMDKVDLKTIRQVTDVLQNTRRATWIDIHNLRVQKFGDNLHIDCHLTLPFYLSLEQVHDEIKLLESEINKALPYTVELFVHTDPCQQIPCALCAAPDCSYRRVPMLKRVNWTMENLMQNKKHQLPGDETS